MATYILSWVTNGVDDSWMSAASAAEWPPRARELPRPSCSRRARDVRRTSRCFIATTTTTATAADTARGDGQSHERKEKLMMLHEVLLMIMSKRI